MSEKVEYYDNCCLKIYHSTLYKIFIIRPSNFIQHLYSQKYLCHVNIEDGDIQFQ